MAHKWIKPSYSSTNGGDCIEWAPSTAATPGTVPVRASKDRDCPRF